MKVIFLDNDGVLCLHDNWGKRFDKMGDFLKKNPNTKINDMPVSVRFDDFDKKAVKVLNEVLKLTGAEIVVSSDWRYHASLKELGEYYLEQGISKKPIGFTEDLRGKPVKMGDLERLRSLEIKNWVEKHPEVTNWVAVDDLNLGNDLGNFVLTPRKREGIKQCGVKDKILKFLT